jgi:OmpA-OmpF porin, OOP family
MKAVAVLASGVALLAFGAAAFSTLQSESARVPEITAVVATGSTLPRSSSADTEAEPLRASDTAEISRDAEPSPAPATAASSEVSQTTAEPAPLVIVRRDGLVEMMGSHAGEEAVEALRGAAQVRFLTEGLSADITLRDDAGEGRGQVARLALDALSRLAEGRAEIGESDLRLTGRALYAQLPTLLSARIEEELPEGWSASVEIDAPEPAAANGGAQCQGQIVARLATDQIAFAVAAATIETDAEPLLDDLAGILSDCPDVAVEVAGHTDSDGSEAANRRLSQQRAAAVRQALVARGIEAHRLSAVGYGQARPIAPNDTPDNKARNRRIELVVID